MHEFPKYLKLEKVSGQTSVPLVPLFGRVGHTGVAPGSGKLFEPELSLCNSVVLYSYGDSRIDQKVMSN